MGWASGAAMRREFCFCRAEEEDFCQAAQVGTGRSLQLSGGDAWTVLPFVGKAVN